MAKIIGSAPVLLVKDVVASAEYFRDKCGFSFNRYWGEPPRFTILRRDGFAIMLRQPDDPADIRPLWTIVKSLWDIYFWVDDVDALQAELSARGAIMDYGLCDQPYGCREFGIQDLDGHDIGFGQDMNT